MCCCMLFMVVSSQTQVSVDDEQSFRNALGDASIDTIQLLQSISLTREISASPVDITRNLTVESIYGTRVALDTTSVSAQFRLLPSVVLNIVNLQIVYNENFNANTTNFGIVFPDSTISFRNTVNRVTVCQPQTNRLGNILRAPRPASLAGSQLAWTDGIYCSMDSDFRPGCWNESILLVDVAVSLPDYNLQYRQVISVCDATVDPSCLATRSPIACLGDPSAHFINFTPATPAESQDTAQLRYIIPIAFLSAALLAALAMLFYQCRKHLLFLHQFHVTSTLPISASPPSLNRNTRTLQLAESPTGTTTANASETDADVIESMQNLNTSVENDSLKDEAQQRVGRDVQLIEVIGSGSFGKVYKALWHSEFVAVKIMSHTAHFSERMILNEVRLARCLRHPNIVQTLDVHTFEIDARKVSNTIGYFDGGSQDSDVEEPQKREPNPEENSKQVNYWLIMEYCSAGNLLTYVRKRKTPLQFSKMMGIALAISSGMEYLHYYHIIHGDLKTENVLLAGPTDSVPHLRVKIADFGLSRMMRVGQDYVNTTNFGTLSYLAPEVLINGCISPPGDVYSFGMLMWELMTGATPWQGLNYGHLVHKIVNEQIRPEIPDGTHPDIALLITSCWNTAPSQRPSFTDIRKRLTRIVQKGNNSGSGSNESRIHTIDELVQLPQSISEDVSGLSSPSSRSPTPP